MAACSQVPAPSNGTVRLLENSWDDPNATITFSCNAGYHLVGPRSLYCDRTGFWNQEPPTCVGM